MSKMISDNIKKQLEEQERSYSWLGRKIGTSGADISKLLTNLEKGGTITVDKLEKIATALGTDITKLLK